MRIYINKQSWNGDKKVSISPTDTIEFKIENAANSQYQFDGVSFEIVLREKFLVVFNKENNRGSPIAPQSQSDRITKGLILYPPDEYVINPENIYNASTNPSFIIPCIRFTNYAPLSRIIVHVKAVKKVTGENKSDVDLQSFGYNKALFRDGFSFWKGKGFN